MKRKGIIETNYSELPQIVHEKQMMRIQKIKQSAAYDDGFNDEESSVSGAKSFQILAATDAANLSFSNKHTKLNETLNVVKYNSIKN